MAVEEKSEEHGHVIIWKHEREAFFSKLSLFDEFTTACNVTNLNALQGLSPAE